MYKTVALPWEEIVQFVKCPGCGENIALGASDFEHPYACPTCGREQEITVKVTLTQEQPAVTKTHR